VILVIIYGGLPHLISRLPVENSGVHEIPEDLRITLLFEPKKP
jgi:ATP-dependent protease Clp ATPase subunit